MRITESRLRLTGEVGSLRPSSVVRVADYELTERAGRPFIAPAPSSFFRRADLPVELVPLVAELNPDDPKAIIEFVRAYGPLGAWKEDFRAMRSWGLVSKVIDGLAELRTQAFGLGWTDTEWEADPAITIAWYRGGMRAAEVGLGDHRGEFLDELVVAAGAVASLVMCHQELGAASFSARRITANWPGHSPWVPPQTRSHARFLVAAVVDAGLREVSLGLTAIEEGRALGLAATASSGQGPPLALSLREPRSLYVACILEFAQVLLGNRPYRFCANEACGRMFSVQEGRSRYGGHRTDVLRYCSRTCGLAQAQREYRRRTKERKGREGGG